jgi:hypothetical protein
MRSARRKVDLKPMPVGTTKSARRRFSASGIWFFRMSANFWGVMPGRRSTRWR